MCANGNNKQSLADIIKEYAKYVDNKYSKAPYTTDENFYKKTVKKLQEILSAFDIDMTDFLSNDTGKRQIYFFNDSQEEIITMLELFDNPIVKRIRLGKNLDYKTLLFDKNLTDEISKATEFANALKEFMNKNGYSLPKDISQYSSTEEFDIDLADNIEKLATYDKNNARFNSQNSTQIEITKTALECSNLLVEMIEYAKDTDSYLAVNEKFVLDKLKVFQQDLQTCLNKYKIHFDIMYNDAYELYPDYEYNPFPPVKYIPLPDESEEN